MNQSGNSMYQTVEQLIEAVRDRQTDTLDLSHFDLTTLPDEVFNLRNLRVLRVCNLLYASHQSFIDSLRKRGHSKDEELLAYYEEAERELQQDLLVPRYLQTLDARVGQLPALEELDLGYNRLSNLPDTLGRLSRLQRLILNNNQLTDVPTSLSELKHLQLLDLKENPLQAPPVLPQLGYYTRIKEHFRQQKNKAVQERDYDLAAWLRGKENSFGLVL